MDHPDAVYQMWRGRCTVFAEDRVPRIVKWMHTVVLAASAVWSALASAGAAERPNVLWLTSEDTGANLGAFGDDYAVTPNLDALAGRGMIYTNCWSTAPVCAPARTVIISGMWAPSLGAEHMRSLVRVPMQFKMYPAYLREAGYYCTNNSKTDYNLELTGEVWDESSGRAHWKNRRSDQPFFAVFNFTISHESQIRNPIEEGRRIHDPARARIPAYHPDTPEVRRDWAQYYDRLTMMDEQVGERLKELAGAGLADNTIVCYYGDHGSGMPRSKRWPYHSGLHVPLVVYIPEKWRHLAPPEYEPSGESDRLVGFYDLAPTLLSLCGIKPPEHMHGRPIMGEHYAPPPEYQFGFRGRMDERYDLVRACRDERYIYIRNYMPHEIYGQYIEYMFETPTTRVWKRLFDEGKLNATQAKFWQTKSPEELYDLAHDPDEVHNLANSSEHRQTLARMRKALRTQLLEWRDLGFLPEGEIHSRAGEDAPWTMGQDGSRYPLPKILEMADLASSLSPDVTPELIDGLRHPDSAIRYWAAMGLLMRGEPAVRESRAALVTALADDSPAVRIVAAEALGRYGRREDVERALTLLIDHGHLARHNTFTVMLALNALEALGDRASSASQQLSAIPEQVEDMPPRMEGYVARLLDKLRAESATVP
jgi:uncharacterized sulfatase